MDQLMLAATIAIVLAVVWVVSRPLARAMTRYENGQMTVYEYEVGVLYRSGKLTDVLKPGRYPTWPWPRTITKVDLRELSASIAGQEILTSDKMSVRVTVVAAYRCSDPRAYVLSSGSAVGRLYQLIQIALRERVALRSLDDLLLDRGALTEGMAEALSAEVAELGLAVSSIKLLDLTLGGPAKQAFADIWRAQKEGVAALERARGEQAALRALANAARQLKGNPELMNLRLLQTLTPPPGGKAPTLILGGGTGLSPVSSEAAGDGDDA